MPQPNSPPYSAGALTIPRMLVRWLDVNAQNGPLTRTMSYVTLPIFNAPVSWAGYSTIVTTFNSEGPNNFSIKSSVAPVNPNYTLCISFIKGGVLTRYLLWQATGSVLPYNIPLYSGQPILKNFRFEVWSTSQGNATQSTVIQMYTSVAGQTDYRYSNDFQLVGNDGQVTNLNNINTPISLPTANLAYRFQPTIGVTPSTIGSQTSTWVDSVSGITLSANPAASLYIELATDPIINRTVLEIIASTRTMQGAGLGLNPGNLAVVMALWSPAAGNHVVASNGDGLELSYNGTTQKFSAFGASSNKTFIDDTTILLVILCPAYNLCYIYNAVTGLQLDVFEGNPTAGPDATVQVGPCGCLIWELIFYHDIDILFTPAYSQLLGYISTSYANYYSLPLTFPASAVSTTN